MLEGGLLIDGARLLEGARLRPLLPSLPPFPLLSLFAAVVPAVFDGGSPASHPPRALLAPSLSFLPVLALSCLKAPACAPSLAFLPVLALSLARKGLSSLKAPLSPPSLAR